MHSRELSDERIAVVGAGFGGLTAAAYLSNAGATVTVYERRESVGGVANRIEVEGFTFDTGPSWYLMPEIFERFFQTFGSEPGEFYDLVRLDPHYRVLWTDGDAVTIPADTSEARAIFDEYEPGGGDALERYLDTAAETYDVGMNRFVLPNRSRFRDYLSLDVARSASGIPLLRTMDDHVARYFDHPKLRQIVQYTLVFLGGAPHNTPALYNLMSHVDFELGVYYPRGGLYEVVEAVASVAEDVGVEIHTDRAVRGIQPTGSGIDLRTADGSSSFDRVICNAPIAHVERDLLPEDAHSRSEGYWDERTYAPSAYMLYLGVEGSVDPLEHHTLVLPPAWDDHFRSIFETQQWPDDPAFYVNVPSQTDPSVSPEGHETVVALVPIAPGLEDDRVARDRMRSHVLDGLAAHADVDLRDRILVEREACVTEFRDEYRKPRGTALGLAHTLRQTGPLRPSFRAPGVDRLYYVGGDANPGIGVPMCLLSGEHVAETVLADAADTGVLDRLRGLLQ